MLLNPKVFLVAVTDKNEYKTNEMITCTLINLNESPAYVEYCGEYSIIWIEKKTSCGWETYWSPIVPAICGYQAMVLKWKEKTEWQISVLDKPGIYRIVIPAGIDSIITQSDKIYTNNFYLNN
ncbi:MAG: hypothetical protein PVF17_01995 [Ignavibacteria bacterium]|jgi:hypothetical protein